MEKIINNNYSIISSPVGFLRIDEENSEICGLEFLSEAKEKELININKTEILRECEKQLLEYFEGRRKSFNLPLNLKGTDFQKRVWQALLKIPYGQTASYGEIAKQVGSPKAARAVGMANNKNPVAIIVPCHRVIGASGKMVGYGGGLDKKEYLLALENNRD